MTTPTILLLLSAVVGLSSSQAGVCYQTRSYAVYYQVYVTVSGSYSYACWWSTCYGTRYHRQLQTRSYTAYYAQFRCCSGYQQNGALQECIPVCPGCDSNHVCAAPYTCVCPDGWTGDDCSEDINECVVSTTCEQNCTNTNGSYSCTCNTGYSLASDLHGCLGPPQTVSMFATSSTSVEVSWNPPILDSWDGYLRRYQISCSSPSGWNTEFTTYSYRRSYQVNSLMPFSTYNCCVAARTSKGLSSSSCNTTSTLEDRPLDPPQNITVVNISASALRIAWYPPTVPNGIIILYKLFFTYENQSREIITVNSTKSSYVLKGLSPHQLVYVVMSATTVVGEGPKSVRLDGRTSQAVPTGVTGLHVRPLSLHQIEISWQPPETTNGILTGYGVTVYNSKLNYTHFVSLHPSVFNVTFSENIEPLIPYTVNVQAFTRVGGGAIEVQVVFTQEGVPKQPPRISSLFRKDATTGEVSWDVLTLDELRGFLESYKVVYQELKSYSCVDIDVESGEAFTIATESATIRDLDPTAEYCVGVAASTAAGVGNYSHSILPVYTNFLFQIHFRGVHNCLLWAHDDPLQKTSVFVDTVSTEMSKLCDCRVPADHVGDTRLICREESPTKVIFQGRLVVTHSKNATELMAYLEEWVSTAPHVIVQGVQLVAEEHCSVTLSELGNSLCLMGVIATERPNSETDKLPTVIGVISTILLVALIILVTCSILLLRKKMLKSVPTPANVYVADPSMLCSGEIPMTTDENSAYGTCFEEYETPVPGEAEVDNIYATIHS